MKRALVIAVMWLVAAANAFGQQGLSEFAIVIEGAGLWQEFSGLPDDVATDGVAGARAGVALRLGGPLYVEPGIGIAGSVYTVSATTFHDGLEEDVEDEFGHAGVRIPLRAGVRFFPASPFNIRFFGGIALTFLTTVGDDNDFELEMDNYADVLWGAEFGGGIDLYFLTLSTFYEKGLTDLFTEDVVELESEGVRLSGIGASVGLRFRI